MGLLHFYKIQTHKIIGKNGTEFEFKGIEQSREEIRGWEGIDRTWVEEAQRMSKETAEVLLPTIFRKPGAQFIVTWNPIQRTDWVWNRFITNAREGDLTKKVNFYDNPFLPPKVEAEIETCRVEDPNLFQHIWLGEPDDGASDTRVLAYGVLQDCVEAWRRGLAPAFSDDPRTDAGLDIADGGQDQNALVVRRGPTILHATQWPSRTPGLLSPTAIRADMTCREFDLWRLNYDSTGVGGPIRGDFTRLNVPYAFRPVNFGDAVGGPGRSYERNRSNRGRVRSQKRADGVCAQASCHANDQADTRSRRGPHDLSFHSRRRKHSKPVRVPGRVEPPPGGGPTPRPARSRSTRAAARTSLPTCTTPLLLLSRGTPTQEYELADPRAAATASRLGFMGMYSLTTSPQHAQAYRAIRGDSVSMFLRALP